MPNNKLESLLNDIDGLIGPRQQVDTTTFTPTSLADRISLMTGLPTAVVEGHPKDTAVQGALQAARAAAQRIVLPAMIGMVAQEATQDIDHSLGQS